MCIWSALSVFDSLSTCSVSPVGKTCLSESTDSAFLISNWSSACTRESKERIRVFVWQPGKQQYATVQNQINSSNPYFLCRVRSKDV